VVTRLVVHPQEADMHTAGSKHGNLKLHINRRTTPRLGSDSRHEFHFGIDMALGLSGKSLDTPHDGLLFRFVLGAAKECLNLCLGCILRDGNLDYHVSGKELIGKVGNHLEVDRDPDKV